MHSKVGLYRKKIFNPLDSSQRLQLQETIILQIQIKQKENGYNLKIGH
jgi:hypothetical protein